MKNFGLILIFLFAGKLFAQNDFGMLLRGGLSRIAIENSMANSESLFYPSGELGGFASIEVSKTSYVNFEAILVSMDGKERYSDLGDEIKQVLYIGVPIYYSFNKNGFGAFAGTEVLVKAKTQFLKKTNNNEFDVKPIDAGLIVGVNYALNDVFTLEIKTYYGLLNISSMLPSEKWHNFQFLIGSKISFKQKNRSLNGRYRKEPCGC